MRVIRLDGNSLGDAGVEALSAILVDCPSISVLRFGRRTRARRPARTTLKPPWFRVLSRRPRATA